MSENGKRKQHPLEFRKEVVNDFYNNGLKTSQICKKYNINRTQLCVWCRWYRDFGVPMRPKSTKPRGRPRKKETDKEKIARLEMENALLKKFHELLKEEHKRK